MDVSLVGNTGEQLGESGSFEKISFEKIETWE